MLGFYCGWGMLRGVLWRGGISTAMDGVEVLVLGGGDCGELGYPEHSDVFSERPRATL